MAPVGFTQPQRVSGHRARGSGAATRFGLDTLEKHAPLDYECLTARNVSLGNKINKINKDLNRGARRGGMHSGQRINHSTTPGSTRHRAPAEPTAAARMATMPTHCVTACRSLWVRVARDAVEQRRDDAVGGARNHGDECGRRRPEPSGHPSAIVVSSASGRSMAQ